MSKVQGTCDPRFEEVRTLLQKYVDTDVECGAAVAVNLDGKDVVDVWAGYKDELKQDPWERDTILNVWSTTKNVSSLAALMMMDRGLIKPNDKVSSVWPEFATNGKEDVEARMLMSHTSGLPGWEEQITSADTYDTKKATTLLEQQAPWHKPGTASAYHAITYGLLVGELVRRTAQKSLTRFIAEEIATPLEADFQIGCVETDWPRVATIIPPVNSSAPIPIIDTNSIAYKVLTNPPPDGNIANTPAFRRTELGGSNGHTNARGLNRILSAISLGGETNGVRLLKPETLEYIFQEQAFGTDLVLGVPIRFGMGFGLGGKDTHMRWLPEGRICFWIGWGGAMSVMDLDRRLTISYVMNKMGSDGIENSRTRAFVAAVYAALGVTT